MHLSRAPVFWIMWTRRIEEDTRPFHSFFFGFFFYFFYFYFSLGTTGRRNEQINIERKVANIIQCGQLYFWQCNRPNLIFRSLVEMVLRQMDRFFKKGGKKSKTFARELERGGNEISAKFHDEY